MKNKNIKVSVIMSEYNTNIKLLKNSIESILNQTYKNFEFIIIDDCGINDVQKIVKKYKDKRIIVHKNKENKGLVYSLNKAIELSTGDYIARMDTDDYSYPDRLAKQVKFLENNQEYDIIGSRVDYYDGIEIWGESSFSGNICKGNFINGSPLTHPSVMYKKEAIERVGGYLNYKRCEDYATWIEMFCRGSKMYILNEKLLRYHLSIDDYKKRSLKTRKGFFDLINSQYMKLNPTKLQILKLKIKTFIAGVMPYRLMFNYHKIKNKKGRIKNGK